MYYIGNFENDLRHGWGVLYCDNNIRLYEGYWLNNEALEKEDEGIETIVEEEYANEATERHWKSSKRVTYQSKYSTRSKVMLKREEKSKLAFKIFKDKSLSKEKS